jgi:formiminotetrahydrofolate cyclodeaminase
VLPGNYFLIVKSKNATDCPENHLSNLKNYEDDLGQLFGFSLLAYKKEIEEIDKLHEQFSKILMADETEYGGYSRQIELYTKIQEDMRERAAKIIDKLPVDVKRKIGIYTGYSDALDFANVRIEEGKPEVVITDFGITCI